MGTVTGQADMSSDHRSSPKESSTPLFSEGENKRELGFPIGHTLGPELTGHASLVETKSQLFMSFGSVGSGEWGVCVCVL